MERTGAKQRIDNSGGLVVFTQSYPKYPNWDIWDNFGLFPLGFQLSMRVLLRTVATDQPPAATLL